MRLFVSDININHKGNWLGKFWNDFWGWTKNWVQPQKSFPQSVSLVVYIDIWNKKSHPLKVIPWLPLPRLSCKFVLNVVMDGDDLTVSGSWFHTGAVESQWELVPHPGWCYRKWAIAPKSGCSGLIHQLSFWLYVRQTTNKLYFVIMWANNYIFIQQIFSFKELN